jgi:hypothetical protein
MATVVGDKEGNRNGGKSNGNGNDTDNEKDNNDDNNDRVGLDLDPAVHNVITFTALSTCPHQP